MTTLQTLNIPHYVCSRIQPKPPLKREYVSLGQVYFEDIVKQYNFYDKNKSDHLPIKHSILFFNSDQILSLKI